MKKALFFAFVAFLFVGCEDEFYIEGQVKTSQPTEITKQSAKLNGEVEIVTVGEKSNPSIVKRGFVIGTNSNNLNNDISDSFNGEGKFSCNANNLFPNSKYYAKAYATINYSYDYDSVYNTNTKTVYGNTVEFTTPNGVTMPIVSTLDTIDITSSGVTLNGTILYEGYPKYKKKGFIYGTKKDLTLENATIIEILGSVTGPFMTTITGLTINVTYYAQTYAISGNDSVIYSGNEIAFTISNQKPQVTTLSPENITSTFAKLRGRIEKSGIPIYSEKGFLYSSTAQEPVIYDDESITTKKVVPGSEVGEFIYNLSGLTNETTYWVRAFATNSEGTAYGTVVSFTASSPNYVLLKASGLAVQKMDINSGATWNTALSLCENSDLDGFTDWRLPTKDELAVLYNNRDFIGGFSSNNYWSSTEFSADYSWCQNFSSGAQNAYGLKTTAYHVRAVRTLP